MSLRGKEVDERKKQTNKIILTKLGWIKDRKKREINGREGPTRTSTVPKFWVDACYGGFKSRGGEWEETRGLTVDP